ncbi:MAG: hypothetical protein LBU92_01485 [Prevotellaceae bacterium]|jgi:hypothetical protein|nr:hypothetical protein [Prevotellaceae bacterium]
MKKSVLALLLAAGVVVAVAACSKEKTDFEKGQDKGKEYCDCYNAATGLDAMNCALMAIEVADESDEYLRGFAAGSAGCGDDE